MKIFKIFFSLCLLTASSIVFESCKKEEPPVPVVVNKTSIAPSTTNGRSNNNVGCVEIASRNTTISVWDKGQIDGDIISLIANGETIISNYTLGGPSDKKTVTYNFGYNGYNYLVLYAHNEGSIPPNTAAISINGTEFQIDSYLTTNGYVDIIVTGFGVDCSSSGGSGTGGGSTTCKYTDFSGAVNCTTGNVAVAAGTCCPAASPFYCSVTNKCYTTCQDADLACTSTVWKGTTSGGGSTTCNFTDFTGTANCSTGNVAVASGICCPATAPFYCAGTNKCYATCESTALACTGIIWRGISSGAGTSTGQAMFWIKSDLKCGNISVTFNGQTGIINSFYSGGAPACGATGCATFTLNPGTYNYTATCTGKSANGQVTVTAGGCFKLELTL